MNLRKWIVAFVAIVLTALVGAGFYFRPDRAVRVATGLVAHNVCSKTFVSGLDPQAVFSETIERDGIRRLRRVLRLRVDRTAQSVEASAAGLYGSRALFREGFGCVLLHGSREPYVLKSDIEALKVPKRRRCCPGLPGPTSCSRQIPH